MRNHAIVCGIAAIALSVGVVQAQEDGPARRGDRQQVEDGQRRGPRDGEGPRRGPRDGEGERRGPRDGEGPGPRAREEALKRFDKDGDGKLSEEERAAGRAEVEARSAQIRERLQAIIDANGDGEIDELEREAARGALRDILVGDGGPRGPRGERRGEGGPADGEGRGGNLREEALKRFDKDGDGKLSDEERQAMREARRGQRQNAER